MSRTVLCIYDPACTDGRARIVYGRRRRRPACINRSVRCRTCGNRGEESTAAPARAPRRAAAIAIVVAVLATASCREQPARVPANDQGVALGEVFTRDLNSGRCVRMQPGRFGTFVVVHDRWCAGANLK